MEHLKRSPNFDEIILNIMPLLKNGITRLGSPAPGFREEPSPHAPKSTLTAAPNLSGQALLYDARNR
jgi:hypothetical protein